MLKLHALHILNCADYYLCNIHCCVPHHHHDEAKGVDGAQETTSDLLHQLRAAEGHAEDMTVEGEVNLILPFRHRPVCSDSKMSYRAFQNPHSFGCRARHQGRVCFKGNAEESVFSWQQPCT